MSLLDVADLALDGVDVGVDVDVIDPIRLIAMLSAIDVEAERTDEAALEIVAAWDKVRSWVEAQATRALADFVRRPETVGPSSGQPPLPLGDCLRTHPADEVAVRCGISVAAAGQRIDLAVALANRHRATWDALSTAAIDLLRARFLVEACTELDDAGARAVEAQMLPRSRELDARRWRDQVRRHVISVDPRSARERHERARADRRVVVRAVENGMAELWALLPAEAALAIATALDARARSIKTSGAVDDAHAVESDTRTLDQLRADVLIEVFEHALRTGELVGSGRLGEHGGHRAHLHVTVPLSVLLGIDDSPAWLSGYGPITADVAREIAGDATWRRLLTDPATGEVLEVGGTTYRPPAVLQRHVEARDDTCRFPGCTRAAQRCDLDHTTPYPHGPTTASNLGALCRRHHRFKHEPMVDRPRLEQPSAGVFEWTLPTGTRATVVSAKDHDAHVKHEATIRRLRELARENARRQDGAAQERATEERATEERATEERATDER